MLGIIETNKRSHGNVLEPRKHLVLGKDED